MKILFVCSSNVCRSPYCEFVFGRLLEAGEVLKGKVEVDSAAVLNHSERLHPKSRQALLNEGFTAEELDAFRPKHIREAGAAFEAADMIIGMTRWHKWLLKKEWKGKFETLSEAATGKYAAIPDPFLARNQSSYDSAMKVIKDYLVKFAEKLKEKLR